MLVSGLRHVVVATITPVLHRLLMYSECREAAFDVEKRCIVVLISLFSSD